MTRLSRRSTQIREEREREEEDRLTGARQSSVKTCREGGTAEKTGSLTALREKVAPSLNLENFQPKA